DRRRRRGRLLDRGEHVALGYATILARAGDGGGIDAAFGRDLAHRRRQRRIAWRRLLNGGSSRRGSSGGRWWWSSGGRSLGSRCRRLGGGSRRAIIDLSEQSADRNGFAILGADLAKGAGRWRRDFDGDLVGLELDQRFIHRHGIAGFLEPAADGSLGDGFAERRNANFSH